MNLDSLKDQVSNLTLYDLKAGVRKVQNGKQFVSHATGQWDWCAIGLDSLNSQG